mgnify:FL=1
MKRLHAIILTALLATALASTRAEAQFVKFSLGLEAGGSGLLLLPTPESGLNISGGAQGGLALDLHFGRFIGVSAAAHYAFHYYNFNIAGDYTASSMQHYIQVPVLLQLRTGKTVAIEAGIVQSILAASEYSEGVKGEDPSWSSNPDPGAAQHILSAAAGLKFYLGNTVYLTLRGTYGLSRAYNIYGYGAIPASAQLGIGFKLYNYRKSAFKL